MAGSVGARLGPAARITGLSTKRAAPGSVNSISIGSEVAEAGSPPGRIALTRLIYGAPEASTPEGLTSATPAGRPGNITATCRPSDDPPLRTWRSAVYRPPAESKRT